MKANKQQEGYTVDELREIFSQAFAEWEAEHGPIHGPPTPPTPPRPYFLEMDDLVTGSSHRIEMHYSLVGASQRLIDQSRLWGRVRVLDPDGAVVPQPVVTQFTESQGADAAPSGEGGGDAG